MCGPLQYGPGVKAYVVHLLIAQMLSLKRVPSRCTSSDSSCPKRRCSATSHSFHSKRHAIERLLASPAMHVDETSLRCWIPSTAPGRLPKRLHPKRGCEARPWHPPPLRRRRGADSGLLARLRARIMTCENS